MLDSLFESIFLSRESDPVGLLVDGFPRSALQADILKFLYDKLLHLHDEDPDHNPRPLFKVVVLYIGEEESIRRQVDRAVAARDRNMRVLDAGVGSTEEVRATDLDIEKAKLRYKYGAVTQNGAS